MASDELTEGTRLLSKSPPLSLARDNYREGSRDSKNSGVRGYVAAYTNSDKLNGAPTREATLGGSLDGERALILEVRGLTTDFGVLRYRALAHSNGPMSVVPTER